MCAVAVRTVFAVATNCVPVASSTRSSRMPDVTSNSVTGNGVGEWYGEEG